MLTRLSRIALRWLLARTWTVDHPPAETTSKWSAWHFGQGLCACAVEWRWFSLEMCRQMARDTESLIFHRASAPPSSWFLLPVVALHWLSADPTLALLSGLSADVGSSPVIVSAPPDASLADRVPVIALHLASHPLAVIDRLVRKCIALCIFCWPAGSVDKLHFHVVSRICVVFVCNLQIRLSPDTLNRKHAVAIYIGMESFWSCWAVMV